ncbi:hypothetical protein [Amycolatopsis sp. NPDC051903]|uniref:hypothetical protein n=1 Tax=Amycolatopsis sp. NPDC051903 TaxID=3363936 RepID=UPI003792EC9E
MVRRHAETSTDTKIGVDGVRFGPTCTTWALADSHRSKLVASSQEGEAFDVDAGMPASMRRDPVETKPWFEFADIKWDDSSPKYRESLAESLMTITVPLLHGSYSGERAVLRKALKIAFNRNVRERDLTAEVQHAISFARQASRNVGDLADPEVLRAVLRALELKLDGGRAATNTVRIRRTKLGNAITYAVAERKLLTSNPLHAVKATKRKFVLHEVDPRSDRRVVDRQRAGVEEGR